MSGATGGPDITGGDVEPSEAELRAAWEEQLRILTPADVIVQTAGGWGSSRAPRASATLARCATRSTVRAR
jgi:hypothetical protein